MRRAVDRLYAQHGECVVRCGIRAVEFLDRKADGNLMIADDKPVALSVQEKNWRVPATTGA